MTWVYTYDNAGNLLTKLQYPYSEGTLGSRIRTYTLGYTDSEWGDLQTHWCGGTFTHDAIGNLTHAGSFDYTWEHGRQLATMYGENVSGGNNDMTVDFTYDADGMRTGKVITKNNYHVHSYAETVTAPTCIAGGYTTYTCACGTTYTGAETPALGHDLTGVGVEDGVLYTCSRCDYSALEDHTHSYSLNVVLPTCTESGYTSHTCDECGYSYTDNITEPWGHQTDDIGVCIRCGIVTIPIPPIIRPPVNPPIVSGMGDSGTSAYALNSDEAPILVSTEITTYSYIYNGGSLSQMQVTAAVTADGETTTTTHTLDFTYDASGGPVSVTYDGTVYFYATNLQGDVTAILNSSGTAVVDYTYSAWGSITSTNGSMKDTLGFYNPLRYRGYVYDTEVGLYYLQSRYYNAGLGRFNAPDAFTSTGQGLLGNNMFAYCNNNPVGFADERGAAAKSCLSADGRIDDTPWRDISPSGGGLRSGNYSSGNSYGSASDKFYTARLFKYITNTDEQVVLDASFLAFYRGVPVVILPIGKEAFSCGIMFIGSDVTSKETVQHEYGHSVHFSQIGLGAYIATVMIPSLVGYWSDVDYNIYYSQPWEYIAEYLGGVKRQNYSYCSNADKLAGIYWLFTQFIT